MCIERIGARLARAAAAAAGLGASLAARAYEHGEGTVAAAGKIKNPAAGWDHLWNEVIIDISVVGIIFALIMIYFLIRYRRRAGDGETGTAPRLSPAAAVAWVVIPVFVFLADDLFVAANGWALWNDYRDVPAERMEIQLESGMYSWDYTYPNGVHVQNEFRVPAGMPIVLRMTSRDTLHSHFIPDFRVKEDSMPGRVTFLWFYPEKPGEHIVSCAAYCGVMHSYMAGKLIVMPPAEFDAWLAEQAAKQGKTAKAA
jgi:cytochrome c oxidase subunit 2